MIHELSCRFLSHRRIFAATAPAPASVDFSRVPASPVAGGRPLHMPLFVYAPPFYLLVLLPTARAFAPRFGAVRRPTPSSQMVADSRARSKAQGRGGCCYKASDCLASTAGNPEGASEPPEPSCPAGPLVRFGVSVFLCSSRLPGGARVMMIQGFEDSSEHRLNID